MKLRHIFGLISLVICLLAFLGYADNLALTGVSTAMFSVVAFGENLNAGAAFANVAGVPDQHMRVEGDQLFISKLNKLIGAAAFCGASATEARLVSPSLRRINPYYIQPVGVGLAPALLPEAHMFPESPIDLELNEPLTCEENGNALQNVNVGVFLADEAPTPIEGQIHTVNFEVVITPVDLTWVYAQITLPDALPVGVYKVVGARLVMAGCSFFRFVPVGGSHRPGGLCAVLDSNADLPEQRRGKMGEWFEFDTNQPPGIEVLSNATPGAATYQGYIDVIPA